MPDLFGIGTTNAIRKLHVQSDQVVVGRFHSNSATGRALIRFVGSATTIGISNDDVNGPGIGCAGNDLLVEINAQEAFRITSDTRRVGIGITNPNARVHIRDDNVIGRLIVQSTDQRTIVGAQWAAGVSQYAYIQGTNDAESTTTVLSLNPIGGIVGVGTAVVPNSNALLQVNGRGRFVGTMTDGGGGYTLVLSSHNILGQGSIGGKPGISFYPTFDNFPSDQEPRRAADILAGFNGGTWGTQYLAFHVGNASNDPQNLTPERVRIIANGNSWYCKYNSWIKTFSWWNNY